MNKKNTFITEISNIGISLGIVNALLGGISEYWPFSRIVVGLALGLTILSMIRNRR